MALYQVIIATTEGPVQLLSLTEEGEGIVSVVCINRTVETAPISRAYHAFVKKPTGLIEEQFGGSSYRIDLDANISAGRSWQLGVYLAHLLREQGNLSHPAESPNQVFWVTGEVNHDKKILPIHHMGQKLERSTALVKELREAGKKIHFVIPEQNLQEVIQGGLEKYSLSESDLIPVSSLKELEDSVNQLEQLSTTSPDPLTKKRIPGWQLALAAILVSAAGIAGIKGYSTPTSPTKPQTVRSPEPIPMVKQILFAWKPIYRTQGRCKTDHRENTPWNSNSEPSLPPIEASQLCAIEAIPRLMINGSKVIPLKWQLKLKVKSNQPNNPLLKQSGESYSGGGNEAGWLIPLSSPVMSDAELHWNITISEESRDEIRHSVRQKVEYRHRW